MPKKATKDTENKMQELLEDVPGATQRVKEGEVIEGKIINIAKHSIYVDLKWKGTGIIYGREFKLSEPFGPYKIGQSIHASVVDQENEDGLVELSIKDANLKNAWTNLNAAKNKQEIINVKIVQANKGGLLAKMEGILGFLPVSQLAPNHYPRVKNSDKQEILRRLKSLVNEEIPVIVLDIDPSEEKLVFSERLAVQQENKEEIDKYKVGDVVDGVISGVVDFGAFIKFGSNLNMEGLIHISELSWSKVKNPQSIVKEGEKIKAEIVSVTKDRIALSLKRLQKDPWDELKIKEGDEVEGKVQNINTYGIFVEVAPNTNGLLHVDSIKSKHPKGEHPYKPGDKIKVVISKIDKKEHRMALSLPEGESQSPEDELNQQEKEAKKVKTTPRKTNLTESEKGQEKPTKKIKKVTDSKNKTNKKAEKTKEKKEKKTSRKNKKAKK